MTRKLVFLCTILLIGFAGRLSGYPYERDKYTRFEQLSINAGLSQSVVNCMLQDSRGFLWFGTQDGLNRYDGYNFVVYRYNPFDSTSISDNNIVSIIEDRRGILWIGTEAGGLNRYDYRTGRFTHFKTGRPGKTGPSDNYILSVCEDNQGNIWLSAKNCGIDVLNPSKGTFTHYSYDPANPFSLSSNMVFNLYCDSRGDIWAGTAQGLNRFDRNTGRFLRDPFTKGSSSLSSQKIYSICEDRSGYLWVGTIGGGLYQIDLKKQTVEIYRHDPNKTSPISDNVIQCIHVDKNNDLWIGTETGGLNFFDRRSGKFTSFRNDKFLLKSISTDDIISILEDRSGIIWLGTYGGGLNKLNRRQKQFHHYKSEYDSKDGIKDVFAISQDRAKNIWVGTYEDGLKRIDYRTGAVTSFRHNPADPKSISSNSINTIFIDNQDILWIGTMGEGLNRFDQKTGTFTHFKNDPGNPNSISDDFVNVIIPGENGILWLGTAGGVNKFETSQNRITRYEHKAAGVNSLSHNEIYALYYEPGILWIGTSAGGLNRMDINSGRFTHYRHDLRNPNSLSYDMTMAICPDPQDPEILWIGTSGGGLNRMDKKKGVFTHFTREQGLPNDYIYGIHYDSKGNLWMSTNRGIASLNTRLLKFRNYDERDGLQSDEFNQYAAYRSPEGELFFGGINGFNRFFPEKIDLNRNIPPVVITGFRKHNKKLLTDKPAGAMSEITLGYDDNALTIEFAALDFISPERNSYMYRMEGFDRDWVDAATSRSATYTNLDPGVYTFHVIAANSDGFWNNTGASVKIVIEPPYWKTWWFRVLMILLAITFLVAGYRIRISRIKKRNRQLEELVKKRTAELQTEIEIRQKVENILRQSEERFRALIENASDAIQILSPQFEALYSSPAMKRLLRVMENGKVDLNILNYLKGEEKENLITRLGFLIESRAGYESIICKASDHCGYELILEISASNQMTNSSVNGIVLNIRDVTEPKKAEEDLRESEERYRKLVELSPLGISFHVDGRFVFVNQAGMKLIGAQKPEEVLGRHVLDFVHPDYKARVVERIRQMKQNEIGVPLIEEKFLTLDGREIDVAVAAISFHYHGKLAHQVVIQDISQFKKAEEAIKRSERELRDLNENKDKFFSIIAHDLKSPFASLLGYSELLVSEFDSLSTAEVRNSINIMNKSVRKIFSLVENLLQWARIQTGKIEFIPRNIDLHELTDNTIALLQVNAISKNIKLTNGVCRGTAIYADHNMVSSVLQNLISNSVKFTGQGGEVRIYSEKAEGGFVKISVADNGVGMDEEGIERLFKIEVHHSTLGTNEEKGTGLGLILCKELIEKNGGSIQVTSQKGKGTNISFLLPEIHALYQNEKGN